MRAFLLATTLLATPAFADTILATSHITAVTIYPQGAQVTRQVEFTAPAGGHELLITDLPQDTDATMLRLSSSDTDLGAFSLRTDRVPPRDEVKSPEQEAAEAAVDLAEEKLRVAEAAVAAINAEVEAQEAQIKFLTSVKGNGPEMTAEGLAGISAMIGAQVLAARKAALAAQDSLPEAEQAVTDAQDDLTAAQDGVEALSQAAADYAALSVEVTSTGEGGHLTVSSYVYDASWAPVYDITLDRKAGTLAVDRGVLVSQYSSEDWVGVDLTLSTARPSDQSAPSQLYPELRSIGDPEDLQRDSDNAAAEGAMPVMEPAPVVAGAAADKAATVATLAYVGDTVVYHYPTPVDVASGVEDLRLALDRLDFKPEIEARAVPRYDSSAFLLAKLTNDGTEILLPGTAYLHRDGALVGSTQLDLLSPGGDTELGFGAIDGIHLKRDMPQRAEGDRGVFSTSTQIEEKAVLEVENLTGEAWKIRLMDQVPYSEQEDLAISYTADPDPTEVDVDGRRGILAWDFDLAAGEKKAVALDTVMSWPEGKVLQ